MCRYTITGAGRLIDSQGNDLEPEGYLNFYTRDPAGHPPDDYEQPGRWREYRARFVVGQLDHIVQVAEEARQQRHYGLASFRWFDTAGYMFDDPDQPPDEER